MHGVPPNYLALGVPIFLAAVIGEWILGRRRGAYRAGTAAADLGVGVVSSVTDAFLRILGLLAYAWVFEHARVVTFADGSLWPWVIGLVGVDLIYYWWHRFSHVVNVLWAVHSVHHQSEDFNYAVALRQPALEAVSIMVFYLPLAALGVDPVIYVASWAINLFYQFWIHTELVGKLGPLEWVLNTPSHHRVHHGINPKYLDRNYAGVLIVWDRMFGTFQEEDEVPVYGVTKPLRSYNPLWANLEHWATMWRLASSAPGLGDKLRVPFAHPAWRPNAPRDEPPEVSRDEFVKYDPKSPPELKVYLVVQFVVTVLLVGVFGALEQSLSLWQILPGGALVLLSMTSVTAWIEHRPWAAAFDAIRQVGLIAALVYYLLLVTSPTVAAGVAAAVALVSVAAWATLGPRRVATSA